MAIVGGLSHSALARLSKTISCLPSESQKVSVCHMHNYSLLHYLCHTLCQKGAGIKDGLQVYFVICAHRHINFIYALNLRFVSGRKYSGTSIIWFTDWHPSSG